MGFLGACLLCVIFTNAAWYLNISQFTIVCDWKDVTLIVESSWTDTQIRHFVMYPSIQSQNNSCLFLSNSIWLIWVHNTLIVFLLTEKTETKTHSSSKPAVPDPTGKQPRVESGETKSTARGHKVTTSPTADGGTQASRKSKNKAKSAKTASESTPPAEPAVPKLEKASPYEFIQAWNALKSSQGIQPYAELLRNVAPDELPRGIV